MTEEELETIEYRLECARDPYGSKDDEARFHDESKHYVAELIAEVRRLQIVVDATAKHAEELRGELACRSGFCFKWEEGLITGNFRSLEMCLLEGRIRLVVQEHSDGLTEPFAIFSAGGACNVVYLERMPTFNDGVDAIESYARRLGLFRSHDKIDRPLAYATGRSATQKEGV